MTYPTPPFYLKIKVLPLPEAAHQDVYNLEHYTSSGFYGFYGIDNSLIYVNKRSCTIFVLNYKTLVEYFQGLEIIQDMDSTDNATDIGHNKQIDPFMEELEKVPDVSPSTTLLPADTTGRTLSQEFVLKLLALMAIKEYCQNLR